MTQEAVKIAVVLEGGMLSAVLSAGVPVEYVLIDYDTDGAEESDLVDVPQDVGRTAEALASTGISEIAGPRVLEFFELASVHLDGGPRYDASLCGAESHRVTCEINEVTCSRCEALDDSMPDTAEG